MRRQMTPRERILAAIDHRPVDRIPTDYWGTAEATSMLQSALGAKTPMELWKAFDMDKILGAGPAYAGPDLSMPGGLAKDYWGVVSRPIAYADGSGIYYEDCVCPLAGFETIDAIEAGYTWPRADWFDFSCVEGVCRANPDYAVEAGYMAPFYMYTRIRGLEQTLVDLASDEEIADHILGRICDFLLEYHRRLFEAGNGKIDLAQVTDDFGMQSGLMIGVDLFDRYFRKPYERMIRLVKDHGIRVFHHDDGSIMPLLPSLVDLGIEVLNPIQWHLPGMDLLEMKRRYGKSLCFHGGIDNQHVLPFGTEEEVVREVETCLEVLASDGTGYILAPCHNVQSITPVRNVIAMYRAADRPAAR